MSGSTKISEDATVTYEDQQKINKFARINASLQELKEELSVKQKDMQNIDDATDELVLLDDTDTTPYQIGEVFVHTPVASAREMLERRKATLSSDVEKLTEKTEEYKQTLAALKVSLYGKFGTNINLDADDE